MDKTLYTARQMADRGELESIKIGNLRRFLMPKGEEQNNAEDRR